MVEQQLWAPWRLEYVRGTQPEGCVLCAKQHETDQDALIVHRGEHAYVVLNLYPYNPGHLMVVPERHVADPTLLAPDELDEVNALVLRALAVLRTAVSPAGFNVGLNLGSAAGAGIPDHMHWQVVPRWSGDTNFMPVIGATKVMAQHLHTTWQLVHDAFTHDDKEQTTHA